MLITYDNYGIDREELKNFVSNNPKLVVQKNSSRHPGLSVLKYARKVFYNNLWDTHPVLRNCRGLVVDEDFNVIQLPFRKIFNYQENDAGLNWHQNDIVSVTLKRNGFMASMSWHDGKVLISTTGSLDSDFVSYAEDYLSTVNPELLDKNTTYMFEICHPQDPHIIPELPGAYLLAVIKNGIEYYSFDNDQVSFVAINHFVELGVNADEWYDDCPVMSFREAIALSRTADHEGYVIERFGYTERIKIKSRKYLFQKLMARKSDIMNLNIQKVEEEFHPLIRQLQKDYTFKTLAEQDRLEYMRKIFDESL